MSHYASSQCVNPGNTSDTFLASLPQGNKPSTNITQRCLKCQHTNKQSNEGTGRYRDPAQELSRYKESYYIYNLQQNKVGSHSPGTGNNIASVTSVTPTLPITSIPSSGLNVNIQPTKGMDRLLNYVKNGQNNTVSTSETEGTVKSDNPAVHTTLCDRRIIIQTLCNQREYEISSTRLIFRGLLLLQV